MAVDKGICSDRGHGTWDMVDGGHGGPYPHWEKKERKKKKTFGANLNRLGVQKSIFIIFCQQTRSFFTFFGSRDDSIGFQLIHP